MGGDEGSLDVSTALIRVLGLDGVVLGIRKEFSGCGSGLRGGRRLGGYGA